MTTVSFFAAGLPKGQPRPRAFSRGGHARVFDPGTAEGWKSAVAVAAHPYRGYYTAGGPLGVSITFHFPRPKTHSKRGMVRENAPVYHVSKPDVDNAVKAVLDALTQIGVWADDSQIAVLTAEKRYADGSTVGAFIQIRSLSEAT